MAKYDFKEVILYFLERLEEKYNNNPFSYEDLLYQISHVFHMKSYCARKIIDTLIKNGLIKKININEKEFYKRDFEAEKALIFLINKEKMKEFERRLK